MKFPQTSEYALRVMAQMTLSGEGTIVTAHQLAASTAIPEPFLLKVLRRLVLEGLLVSKKGVGGGFALARPPHQISMGDILRAVGYPFAEEHCLFGWEGCDAGRPCPLHKSWSGVKSSFTEWAARTTLASITRPATPARGRLAP